ncbi:MAG: hypothetical protein GY928_05470 [Colwellia sp.]|nr:hypothetical protein [Colwellia sp.]
MTYSSGSRITKTPKKQRLIKSRDGGEHTTQKESKGLFNTKGKLNKNGHRQARQIKQNQFNLFAEG